MKNTEYREGMQRLSGQLSMEKIIASPAVLVGCMRDLWLPEKDIELMSVAMRSSCASTLLTLIRDMNGTEQEYRTQKKMLMDEAYLGDAPAHRVLVGLWTLVGKDADAREKSGSGSQSEKRGETQNRVDGKEELRTQNAGHAKKKKPMAVWYVILAIAAVAIFFAVSDPMRAYRSVMMGSKTFISADTGLRATIDETHKCFEFDARKSYAQEFAVVDIDRDGKDEIVVNLSEEGFRLVLDKQGLNIYGYLFGIRSMQRVYADGTYDWSSSAFDSGTSYAQFDGRNYSDIQVPDSYANKQEVYFHSFSRANIENYVK